MQRQLMALATDVAYYTANFLSKQAICIHFLS